MFSVWQVAFYFHQGQQVLTFNASHDTKVLQRQIHPNQLVVGIFGETYDASYDSRLKNFGLILLDID